MILDIVFMGSTEFSCPILHALIKNHHVKGVVAQPDRRSGRGQKISSPQTKQLAIDNNIPIIQPETLKSELVYLQISQWKPELIVVAAYGQILRENILHLPKLGCINIHASLLPRWRGASPIQMSIMSGDTTTGVTIMLMDKGLDTGPILDKATLKIDESETADSLSVKLSELGASLLINTIPAYVESEIKPIPQTDSEATYAPIINKSDGELDFSLPAIQLERTIRAYTPWPGTFTIWNKSILKIHKAAVIPVLPKNIKPNPGQRTVYEGRPAFVTGEGLLVIKCIQQAGKNKMDGTDFLRGVKNW